jgi:hypothetical protein
LRTIVFLEHRFQDRLGIPYMAYAFAERWAAKGHRVLYHRGLEAPPAADVAICHVDLTIVPPAYRDLARRYEHVVNAKANDISKRRYSDCILEPGTDWHGPVVVKTDANHFGKMELLLERESRREGVPSHVAPVAVLPEYTVYPSVREVPERLWSSPGINVEKCVPERDERGYYLRVWTFFGDRERSSRYLSKELLIKSSSYLAREAVAVPDEMRRIRERLGFDYGKFDYVRHDGRYYLLDANRTPASPARFAAQPDVQASYDELAAGLDVFT